jgi:hypothetical protein
VVIWGWYRPAIVLGAKHDECAGCGFVGSHVIVRRVLWAHVFWIPIVPLWLDHGLVCSQCGTLTALRLASVRAALRAGLMPLDRPRPLFAAAQAGQEDAWGRVPDPAQVFDPVAGNPKRGMWDLYLKAWVVLAAVVVGLIVLRVAG